MRGYYLELCLCSGLGGNIADDLETGSAAWGQQSAVVGWAIQFSRQCIRETSPARTHVLLMPLFI